MTSARVFPCIVLVCALSRPASAQIYEMVGIRAQGMKDPSVWTLKAQRANEAYDLVLRARDGLSGRV